MVLVLLCWWKAALVQEAVKVQCAFPESFPSLLDRELAVGVVSSWRIT